VSVGSSDLDQLDRVGGLPPRWMQLAVLLLAGCGLAVSVYLTFEHYSASATLACPDTGRINCVKVTSSAYSTLLGVPVAVLGLAYYAALVPMTLPRAWAAPAPMVHRVRLAMVSVGLLFVLYLVWAELFAIHAICLWCTSVHVITAMVFVLVVFAEALRLPTAPARGS
jgi:uncharacterized membrane protein